MSSSAQIATLLEQTGWIRSLARSLVADAHLADDLVQEAWVAALERPPAAERPSRGWIATILRHRVRDLRRERGHREERERSAARHEALPSAHELIEKASIQRKLVAAVLELDEPYRTTVLLRFFEELPQREIDTLARRSDGSCVEWGGNGFGQCNVAALPPGLGFVDVAAGSWHTANTPEQ